MLKILVTGANGYVGSAVCKALSKKEIDFVAGVRIQSRCNEFSIGDMSATTNWMSALNGCSTVVHLAARVHIMNEKSTNAQTAFRMVNVDATMNLARQAAQCGVRRFIFMSSIGVNGAETFSEPFSELLKPQPHSPYALSKFEAEEEVKSICASSDMEFVIIRPPLVYGSHAPGNFKNLLKIVSQSLPLPFGSIRNLRSMISLENLVDFIELCIHNPNAADQIFVVADGEDISTPELIETLGKGMGKNVYLFPFSVKFLEFGADILGRHNLFQQLCGSLQIDTAKARNLLNWLPPVSVYEGLHRTAQGYLNEKIV